LKWLRKICQALLIAVVLFLFLTPTHFEIEFLKYVCSISLLGCIAIWVVIIGLIAAGAWAWITEVLQKRRAKKPKDLSGETLIP
jgi:hypothetical protein